MTLRGSKSLCSTNLQPICWVLGSASHARALSGEESSGLLNSWPGLFCWDSTAHTESSEQGLMLTFLRRLYTFKCFKMESLIVLSHSRKTPYPPSVSFNLKANITGWVTQKNAKQHESKHTQMFSLILVGWPLVELWWSICGHPLCLTDRRANNSLLMRM